MSCMREEKKASSAGQGQNTERFVKAEKPESMGHWRFHDILHRTEWGEHDPYDVAGEEEVISGTIDKEYGLLMEIDTPRELHGLTRSWVPSHQQSSSNAIESSRFAFGTAFCSLLERLRQKFSSMSTNQFEGFIQRLRKIDGKVTDEIHRCNKRMVTHENGHKASFRAKQAIDKLSVSDQMQIVASHLQDILNNLEVSEVECLKVVETAASHGRIVLVLENLFRGLWEQTDRDHKLGAEYELEAQSRNDSNRTATYINVASLKMREGHADKVSALYLSDDGKTLFSADRSGKVMVWYLIDGEQVVLNGGSGRISQLITSTYKDGAMTKKALDATGLIPRFKITEGTDLLIGSSEDGSVCIWDLDRGRLRLKIPRAHGDAITSVVMCDNKEGESLAGLTITADEDGVIRVWDVRPMMEIGSEPVQLDMEWVLDKMTHAPIFSRMSRTDLLILVHSMELRNFEPMERIIWSNSEIRSENQNRGRDFADEEFERLRATDGASRDRAFQQNGSEKRKTGGDVLVFVLSGIALATANETVLKTFRPGDCLGGSGWLENYIEADYNGVAKTEMKCLLLHRQMFSLIKHKEYGNLLSVYVTEGIFASQWHDLDLSHRVGLASVLSAEDQKSLSEFGDNRRPPTIAANSCGRQFNSSRLDKGASMPVHSSASLAEKGLVPVSSAYTPRMSSGANADPGAPEHGAPSNGPSIIPSPGTTPLTPFSSRKESRGDALEHAEENPGRDMGAVDKPSTYLCTAAQIYGRKLREGDTWRMVAELRGHTSLVSGLALDGKGRLISASRDMTVRVWDLHKICARVRCLGEKPRCFSIDEAAHVSLAVIGSHPANSNGHRSWVTGIAASGPVAVSVSYDSTIKIWSMRAGEVGRHLRTISCDPELQSLRLERICITENGEFGLVCGQMGIFQIWRLIDGVRLPPIRWGGLADVPDQDLGDRMTNFDALSVSGGAALVATCRDADILLWNSETRNGIVGGSRILNEQQWGKVSTDSLNAAAQALSEPAKSDNTLKKLVRKAIEDAVAVQSAAEMDNTQDAERQWGSSRSEVKASKTVEPGGRGNDDCPGKSQSFAQHREELQHDAAMVTMPTGKIVMLPGRLKNEISDVESQMAQEYNTLKLQMKSILRYVKDTIKNEGSKVLMQQSPTSPGKQASRTTPVQSKERLRDTLWKLNKNADPAGSENWRERLCVLTSGGEFKYVSHKSKETEEDAGMFSRVCRVSGILYLHLALFAKNANARRE